MPEIEQTRSRGENDQTRNGGGSTAGNSPTGTCWPNPKPKGGKK